MARALGLDFGTTNTVLALADGGAATHSMRFTSSAGETDTMRTALSFMKDPVMGERAMLALRDAIPGCPEPLRIVEGGHFVQEHGARIADAALAHWGGR